ncbi:hypothetical protein CAPTEDRAFT_198744 [Capitella teleta]|uniref:xanthine dehydrogenase n=1 Tax=Capitella teleta TaxID=283909 RepID=R7V9A5_CAPTE|nr:hypothetical protein CAPTEDRAFT_198744 [Capitella teleta]|eukprot:ELU12941.1 hypothetical protein CAPTEDRAFT_198744 [Capitella teleta]
MEQPDVLVFYVNGRKIEEANADPEWTLLRYLRDKLRLTGTKLGCAEGGCGACTVMVSTYDAQSDAIRHFSMNACLAPLCAMHGLAVTTVEGIGSTRSKLHPVQERLARLHGSQCGFCTPGIIMSMYALLRNHPVPSAQLMEEAFEGNLCRCTGYRPILDGFKTFTKLDIKFLQEFKCPMGENCCKNNAKTAAEENPAVQVEEAFAPYEPSQEPIFPPELQLESAKFTSRSLFFSSDRVKWFRPVTLQALLELRQKYPQSKLVIGNTEIGVEVKFKNLDYPVRIAPTHIPELNCVTKLDDGILFGSSVTLTQMRGALSDLVNTLPESKTRVFRAILEMLRWFAGQQVRNVAAIAGNIITASPISDLNPLFLAAGCVLKVASMEGGTREVKMDGDFFKGYRKTAVKPDEVMVSILVPFTKENEYFDGFKQAHRRDDDISIVNAGMRVVFNEKSNEIEDIHLAFGGMAPVTVLAKKTMANLVGKKWDDALVPEVCQSLQEELQLAPGTPGGMESYRNTLTMSFFFKFYLRVLQSLSDRKLQIVNVSDGLMSRSQSALPVYERGPSKASQYYDLSSVQQNQTDVVGRPIPHLSAKKQATGEAVYIDDIPKFENELYAAFVVSTKAHAELVSVDPSEALKLPGVFDYIDHKDVPGSNSTGHVIKDEEVFATTKVTTQGQVIGLILANDQSTAQRAAKAVKIEYKELTPIITIEQATEANSFMPPKRTLRRGDVEKVLKEAPHVVEGEMRVGGQEHFYLETHACIAIPKGEDGEVELIASTQNPTATQARTGCTFLGCPSEQNRGGFGGKETRSTIISTPLAIAASKHQRPVRSMLDRDEDMVISGTRHPFLGKYKVAYNDDGKLLAVDIDLYSNCGNSLDLSYSVMERAMYHIDNAYYLPASRVTGHLCKTNTPSNTAFRGFGGPQGMMITENWMTEIAAKLGKTTAEIQRANLYQEKQCTPYGQPVINCNLTKCWDEVIEKSDYETRQKDIAQFNADNRWKKRGLALVPVKFGIAFTATFLNQAGALVHVYTDGSVLLTHGGTEMGQGLHTKMVQVASRALGVPIERVHISETSTATVPNTSATAASASSDLNGMAVLRACGAIVERLKPFKERNPDGKWDDWVQAAYMDRVSLSATGFYSTPDVGYDWEKGEGNPFNYFTQGVACSEVEIDCLTGDHTVRRTDIVMDVGNSLNPAIDVGQIEGAFVQGYGMFTLEEQRYSPDGFLLTRGPGAYKIPAFTDIPLEFNVSLLRGASNPKAVHSSKAIGEPPLFLSASVFYAIKEAVKAARSESGLTGSFRFDSPATAEKIRMGCMDQFTEQFPAPAPGTYKPWYVNM